MPTPCDLQIFEILERTIDGLLPGLYEIEASAPGLNATVEVQVKDAVAASRMPTRPSRLLEPGRRIDWAFIRGPIRTGSGKVHNQVRASDHYPISFTLTASRG